jgi:hypothetical protein
MQESKGPKKENKYVRKRVQTRTRRLPKMYDNCAGFKFTYTQGKNALLGRELYSESPVNSDTVRCSALNTNTTK